MGQYVRRGRQSVYMRRQEMALRLIACIGALVLGASLYFATDDLPITTLPVFSAEETGGDAVGPELPPDYKTSGWREMGGVRSFYQDGIPAEGLTVIGEDTYYFIDHNLSTGFYEGRYFAEDGRMATEAFTIDGNRYLPGEAGVLTTGWDGVRYYDANGVMAVGMTEIDGATYHFDQTGRMTKGYLHLGDGTRYFDETGAMAVGETEVDGVELDFGSDGIRRDSAYIPVKVISQYPELPNGCEVTSLAQVLRYMEMDVTHTELVAHLPMGETVYIDNDVWTVPDPEEAYVGHPAEGTGWYCFEGPVIAAANSWLGEAGSDLTARALNEPDEQMLLAELQAGKPVIVWITRQLVSPSRSTWTWILPDGSEMHPYRSLHCVVLAGIDLDSGNVTLADPVYGRWTADLDRFMEVFKEMGRRAVVIE